MNNLKHLSLIILDGLGESDKTEGNAYKLANTPFLDYLKENYPSILMNASEKWVGLPKGQMGNSEVGHLNIGAGRVIKQSILEIEEKLNDKNFKENPVYKAMLNKLKKSNVKLHIIGLFSTGGVHSSLEHFYDIKNILDKEGIEFVLHAFTDGRDSAPDGAINFLKEAAIKKVNIGSISGRYYAMDRDRRWERIQLAYDVMVNRKGKSFTDPIKFIEDSYKEKVTDEFIIPGYNKNFDGQIKDNDVVFVLNFRADRVREIGYMLVAGEKSGYDYKNSNPLKNIHFVSLKEIVNIDSHVLFETKEIKNTLGDVLEQNGITQIRAAETEKYPHVTFFIDGGKLLERKGGTKILVHSPKVATYDLKPEMSAIELTERLLQEIPKHRTSIINYANPDMVGHTGVLQAAIKAVETIDGTTKKLYDLIVKKEDGVMLITADHGNVERIINDDGSICTTHTTNPVRLFLVSNNKELQFKDKYKKDILAKLGNLAPTFLDILDLKIPKEMTEESLIK